MPGRETEKESAFCELVEKCSLVYQRREVRYQGFSWKNLNISQTTLSLPALQQIVLGLSMFIVMVECNVELLK